MTENALRERYNSQSSEELLALRGRGTLTELAARVLEEILDQRGISHEQRAEVAAQVQDERNAKLQEFELLASLGQRLAGELIDIIVIVLYCLAWSIVGGLTGMGSVPLILALIIGPVVAYLLLADAMPNGQSIGKALVRTAVVDAGSLRPCTVGQSFLRNLLRMLLGIIDLVFIFFRRRQRLGDLAAGTLVVKITVLAGYKAQTRQAAAAAKTAT